MQHGPAADGAAHHDGSFQFERVRHRHDRLHIGIGGEPVNLGPETARRRGLAVPGQVEGDDAEPVRHRGIVQDMAVLAPVAPGRVQAEKRHALAGLLEIDPVRPPGDGEAEIAPGDGLDGRDGRSRFGRRAVLQRREQHLQQQEVAVEFHHVARHGEMPGAAHGGERLEARSRLGLAEFRPGGRLGAQHEVGGGRARRRETDALPVDGRDRPVIARTQIERQRPETALQGDMRVGVGPFPQKLEHRLQSLPVRSRRP